MPAQIIEAYHRDVLISTDPQWVDVAVVHRFLSYDASWAIGRPYDVRQRAIEHSHLVVGAYLADGSQVGFARMVTDLATWAWLCDVYVLGRTRRRCRTDRGSLTGRPPRRAGNGGRVLTAA